MKFLIARWGTLGDLVLTFPVFSALKRKDWEVSLFTRKNLLELSLDLKIVDGGIPIDSTELLPLFSDIPIKTEVRKFILSHDIIISYSFPEDIISKKLKSLCKEKLIIHPVPKEALSCHITDHLLLPLKSFGIEGEVSSGEWRGKGKYITIHPGSGSVKKRWNRENFLELSRILSKKKKVRIILGESEMDEIEYWEKTNFHEVIFSPTFKRLKEILINSSIFIGNDSGVTHLSAYLGVPTIAIFGSTSPEIWGPRGKRVKIIYEKNCKDLFCLKNISVLRVLKEAQKILSNSSTYTRYDNGNDL